jgi:tetratricopeptide (TPR) repeat protein
LLLDFWPLRRGTGERPFLTEWRPLIREKWPFFLLSGIFCLLTFLAQRQSAVISLQQLSPGFRLKNAVVSYAGYLGQILWPTDLGLIYQLPGRISAGEVVFPGVVLLVISLLVWRWRRSQPWFLTGWLWFLGMLAPVIGLVQVGNQARADRYTYLSAVGLYVAAVFGVARMRARFQWPTGPVWLAAILILTGSVLVTEHQLTFWRDSETLYQHTLAVTSNNGSMHLLLGSLYEHQGRSEEARRQYHAALDCFALTYVNVDGEERPCAAQVQLFFGQDAEQKGRPDEAMAHYREALRLDDHLVEAHNNLGNLLDEQGRSAEALTHYESAVRLRPETALVHENLGTELVTLGRFDEAMREYQVAARLAPAQPQPWYLTGKARLRHGDSQAAVAAFEAALRLDAEDVPSLTFLARVLASDETPRIRDGARAVTLAEKANTLTAGRQPFVLGALAMAYAECGRFTDARQTARTALELATNGSGRMLANQREQLQLYEADRPFRESFTPSPAPPSEPPPPSTSNAGGHR